MKFCVNLDALSLRYYKLERVHKVGLEEIENTSSDKRKKLKQLGFACDQRGRLQSFFIPPQEKTQQKKTKSSLAFVNVM